MRVVMVLAAMLVLGGCESLPHDGPAAKQVVRQAAPAGAGGYALVDLTYPATQIIAAAPPRPLASLAAASSNAPNDLLEEGDVLSVSLFQSELVNPQSGSQPRQDLPRAVIDRNGAVSVPLAGAVRVAGRTPVGAAEAIRAALKGRVAAPQVVVNVVESRANSVTVIGEVRNAGRFSLAASSDRLLDVLALAGGPTRPIADVTVYLVRGNQTASIPLSALMRDPAENIRLAPRDQLRLLYKARKFSTFGALGKTAQIAMEDDTVSLASAISLSGGLDTNSANAASIYVFRFERPEVAQALGLTNSPTGKGVPVVYRLNLREPQGYFIGGAFDIEAGDLVYVPRSDVTEIKKFFDLVTAISQVAYNVRVTTVFH